MTTDLQGDCWDWPGAIQVAGYGALRDKEKQKTVSAHRYFYEKLVGKIPQGLFVLHTCDHRLCVNPAHLYIGTAKDNTWDAINRKRATFKHLKEQRGEKHPQALLTQDNINEIRMRYSKGGITQEQLSKEYRVTKSGIHCIIAGKTWNYNYSRVGYKRCGDTKLTKEQVNEIRAKYAKGNISHRGLAKEYGVVKSQIGNIINRRHWKEVKNERL